VPAILLITFLLAQLALGGQDRSAQTMIFGRWSWLRDGLIAMPELRLIINFFSTGLVLLALAGFGYRAAD